MYIRRTLGILAITAVTAVFASLIVDVVFDHSPEAEATGARDLGALSSALNAIAPTGFNAAPVPAGAHGVGLVDPTQGIWHLRTRDGDPASFFYGNPGDYPFMGDWDCNGTDTPGLYRQSDGYVYLRNSNTQGPADIRFFFGDPGDVPLAGDFNGDGCDTLSLYRPPEARIYVINKLGQNDGGLGEAEYSYIFGNPGDKPFTGDFNGNGTTTVGLHRESTGYMYFRNTNTQGIAHYEFYFGNPGDRLIAGDWTGANEDFPAVYRPSNRTVYMRFSNTQGNADEFYQWGESNYIPVAGDFGALDSGVTVNVTGGTDQINYAVESFYQDQQAAPHIPPELRSNLAGLFDYPKTKVVTGTATHADVYGRGAAVVEVAGDTLLVISDNGWEWKVVGANPAGLGRNLWYGGVRHVAMIGTDWQKSGTGDNWPTDVTRTNADSVHIYSVNSNAGSGAILGFPRSTYIDTPFGHKRVAKTAPDGGPENTVASLIMETGLPLEGYLHTGMGSSIGGGSPPPGFQDLVEAYGGFAFLVPYDAFGGGVLEGDTFLNGAEAIAWGRERQNSPHGGVDRTLNQGSMMKAALASIQPAGMSQIPNLLSIMDDYVNTDLSIAELVTLAATVYTLDHGPMPSATPQHFHDAGHTAGSKINDTHWVYDQNAGTLPNVMIKGCLYSPDGGATFGYDVHPFHQATFVDLQDGILSANPWVCDDGS
ncbi:MAG: LCP family protein [Acidimicrobiia bacterium]